MNPCLGEREMGGGGGKGERESEMEEGERDLSVCGLF